LLLIWFQEGGILGIAWNTKESEAYAYYGDATFDNEDPDDWSTSLEVKSTFSSYHLQPA
jgi:hypothetical protein